MDTKTALITLRAAMARISHEVEALAGERNIASVRAKARPLAERMRDLVMSDEMVEASKR